MHGGPVYLPANADTKLYTALSGLVLNSAVGESGTRDLMIASPLL